jgi:ABC-type uncharacterized transport system substrate-binding protein
MTLRLAFAAALLVGLCAAAPLSQAPTPIQQLFILKQIKPDVERVGIVWNGQRNHSDIMPAVQRAGANAGIQVFVVSAEGRGNVAAAIRQLIRENRVDALWVVRNDGLVEREPSRSYLIREAAKNGLPILTPSADWVRDGASLAVFDQGGELRVSLNRPVAQALGLRVPADLAPRTNFVAAR